MLTSRWQLRRKKRQRPQLSDVFLKYVIKNSTYKGMKFKFSRNCKLK